jgi:hypothetical protein
MVRDPRPSSFGDVGKTVLRHTHELASSHRFYLSKNIALVLSLAVPLTLIGTILWLIFTRAPLFPVSDEWQMVTRLRKLDEGTLGFSDFWSWHNEHRIVSSKVIGLAVIQLTDWNRQAHSVVAIALVGLTAAMLLRAAWWTIASSTAALALTAPVLVLCFSLTRYENWALPFTDKIPTALGVGMCVWALAAPIVRPQRLMLAIVGALIASVSSSGGLLTWFAFAPAVLVLGWQSTAAWSMAAIAVIVPYMKDFPTGRMSSPETAGTFTWPSISDAIGFVFAFLGGPVGYPNLVLSQAFGILSLVVLAVNLAYLVARSFSTPRQRRTLLVWIGLAGFALVVAVVLLIGRGQVYGLESALRSRFLAFSVLWWIALLVLSAASFITAQQSPPDRVTVVADRVKWHPVWAFSGVALAIAGLGLMTANLLAFNLAVAYFAPIQRNQHCLLNYETASDACLLAYYPKAESLRIRMSYFARRYTDQIENTVEVPPPQVGKKGRFRCEFANIDARASLPNAVPLDVVSDVCRRMEATAWGVEPPPIRSRDLCALEESSTLGIWINAYGEPWCTIDWYDLDRHFAATLIRSDGSFVIHAYEDGSIEMFVNGQKVARPRKN